MAAYYNDNDPKVCAWLRELISEGLIAPGEVDSRPIQEIKPDDLKNFVQCHFFAGIGGWSRALRLAGWSDDDPVWTCSCPCQPFSAAGQGRGTDDERHLWPIFFRLVEACGPGTIFGEQVASAAVVGSSAKPSKRRPVQSPEPVWLDGVFADLESARYACGASDLPAACVSAPHIRQRAFWVAYADQGRFPERRKPDGTRRDQSKFELSGATGRLAESDGREPSNRDIQRSGEHRQQPQNGCSGSGVALAHNSERGTDMAGGNNGNGSQTGRDKGHSESGECCEIGRMDNTTGNGAGCADETEQGGNGQNHGLSGATGSSGGKRVGNTKSGGCGEQRDAAQPGSGGHTISPSGAGLNPWSEYRIIVCRDGKARRIPGIPEPCFQSLVDGFSDDVDAGWRQSDGSIFPLAKGIQGRTGILRGAGNSIAPEVAAQFIQASEEARQGLHPGRLLTLADF